MIDREMFDVNAAKYRTVCGFLHISFAAMICVFLGLLISIAGELLIVIAALVKIRKYCFSMCSITAETIVA